MFIDKHIDEFLSKAPDGYSTHLYRFKEFLINQWNLNPQNERELLQGLSTSTVIKSISYLVSEYKISSASRVTHYSTALKEFIYYLFSYGEFKNREILDEIGKSAFDEKSYRNQINTHIKKLELNSVHSDFEAFTDEEVLIVVEECNNTLQSAEMRVSSLENKSAYEKIRSSLIFKFIIQYGFRYNTMTDILETDVNIEKREITVNGFIVDIPYDLILNINNYLILKRDLNISNISNFLFAEYNGDQLRKTTTSTASYLKTLVGRNDLTGLIKYSICKMITNEVQKDVIMKFTNIGLRIYDDCYEICFPNQELLNRNLNSKLKFIQLSSL
ncbi:hypothetical protein [Bacillus sp. es.036]|uniref:hypothetical protein n=1 Tax=Bacillus sp. es.036 TaxID=1761764 RepID=UPI000BF29EEC|nr:hypothetical protein [Bacillus sp. es.036]PFG13058.1 hypothetical protein ATG70_1247 [Bacillus sp. es.036]